MSMASVVFEVCTIASVALMPEVGSASRSCVLDVSPATCMVTRQRFGARYQPQHFFMTRRVDHFHVYIKTRMANVAQYHQHLIATPSTSLNQGLGTTSQVHRWHPWLLSSASCKTAQHHSHHYYHHLYYLYRAYDFDSNEEWQAYLRTVEISGSGSGAEAALRKLKAKWYKRTVVCAIPRAALHYPTPPISTQNLTFRSLRHPTHHHQMVPHLVVVRHLAQLHQNHNQPPHPPPNKPHRSQPPLETQSSTSFESL